MGRSSGTVRSWERDKSHPTEAGVITALSAVLGVDERTMFEKAGQEMPVLEESPTVEQALATLSPDVEGEVVDIEEVPPPLPLESESDQAVPEEPSYLAPPEPLVITTPAPPLPEPSYMEDRTQRQLYRVRNLATIVILVSLGIAFLWALTQSVDAFGTWWDEFFGNRSFVGA